MPSYKWKKGRNETHDRGEWRFEKTAESIRQQLKIGTFQTFIPARNLSVSNITFCNLFSFMEHYSQSSAHTCRFNDTFVVPTTRSDRVGSS